MPRVLVVDDDPSIFLLVKAALSEIATVVTADNGEKGLERVRQGDVDVVLLDIMLPDIDGMAVFCEIREFDRRLPVVFMTIEATSNTAIEAMQRGAFDYLAKPLDMSSLRMLATRAIEQRELSSVPVAIAADDGESDGDSELFIGRSKPMLEVFKDVGRVSKQDVPVLIRGESGTGKELVARALFQYSHRAEGPFLAVNCAALPDTLLESELFGHEKGAFTGADRRRVGKFEQCNDGTLFLDEIGDMAPVVQAKVLRVLQDQRFERIGGNNVLKTDVRIVAATNQPLEDMVVEGDFREDLLYRLNAVTIHLPPLRDRPQDIPLLIQHFLGRAKREFRKPDLEGVSPETVEMLKAYRWPGNVRQLRAVVRRCVIDSVLPVLVPDVLPVEIRRYSKSGSPGPGSPGPGSPASGSPGSSVTGSGPNNSDARPVVGEPATSTDGPAGDGFEPTTPSPSPTGSNPNAVSRSDSLSHNSEVSPAGTTAGDGDAYQTQDGSSELNELSNPAIPPGNGYGPDGEPNGYGLPTMVENLLNEHSSDLYAETISYVERYLLLRVLRLTDGNQSRAAEVLGITRGKLRDRIATYNIQLGSGVKIRG